MRPRKQWKKYNEDLSLRKASRNKTEDIHLSETVFKWCSVQGFLTPGTHVAKILPTRIYYLERSRECLSTAAYNIVSLMSYITN